MAAEHWYRRLQGKGMESKVLLAIRQDTKRLDRTMKKKLHVIICISADTLRLSARHTETGSGDEYFSPL